jgi:hypothetical protein
MMATKETEDQIEARMEAARNKLSQEVQDKFNKEGDVDERDRRLEAAGRLRRTELVEKAAPAAKAKAGVVTKEQLAKSGLTLREYMNKQQGKTARGGAPAKAPSKVSAPAVSSSYRSEGANKAKPAASSGNVSSAAPAPKPKALAISSGVLKQREADEKRREERRELGRQQDAKAMAEKEKFAKDLSNDPKQMAIRKERESEKSMSPAERSAARGKAVKEFFGMAKGGSVRGSGIAQRGVRKCKMV